jgi:putative ABC transport system permease protein
MVFGLAPALHVSRVDLSQGLRDASQTVGLGWRTNRGRRLLIVAELVLSLVLLVGFGLLGRSFSRVQSASGGFRSDALLETATEGGREFAPAVVFWRAALERARSLPGVESAAVSSRPPVHGARQEPFVVDGLEPPADVRAGDILISGDYFRTMGIPLLKGRAFTEQDTASSPPVVIVSDTLVRRCCPGRDPLGLRLKLNERDPMTCCTAAGPVEGVWREIVGVVGDIRQGNMDEAPAATLYRPYSQIVEHDMYLLVRAKSAVEANRIAPDLRRHLAAAGAGKDWSDVVSAQDVIAESESIRLRRFVLVLFGSFAGVAVVLAGVGLYGIMAYSVAERSREIGIRVALGATPSVVVKEVIAEAMRLASAGLVVGVLVAQILTRVIATMLFDVTATDAVTYAGVSLLLLGVALAASYLPARRAVRVDPMQALREG